ncbi:helix-turn-helix domain-containing protein [Endozoicomonas ascidiicola]
MNFHHIGNTFNYTPLQQQEFNLSAVARVLDIPRTTLISRMKKLGIR